MFKGVYHGRQVHAPDLYSVLQRAKGHGIDKIMVTAGTLEEAREAIQLVRAYESVFPEMLSTTVGVHPTRCSEFDAFVHGANSYMEELITIARRHKEFKIKAIGEFGLGNHNTTYMRECSSYCSLDYDRVQFCSRESQRQYFEKQFVLADEADLPLFLHMRDAATDFIEIVKRNRHRFRNGVVHSFTGTADEAKRLLELDLFIGINGCSLKTKESVRVVQELPIDRIMVESDAPWCEIRASHAVHSFVKTKLPTKAKEKHSSDCGVKSRNEPIASLQVLECIAALKDIKVEELADRIYSTTVSVFGP